MPTYFPEGNEPRASDASFRSLQKINDLLYGGAGGGGGGGLPVSGATAYATTPALDNDLLASAVAATLFSISGFNTGAVDQYFQVFDSAAAVANGTVPILVGNCPGGAPFSYDISNGIPFTNGIYICNSTTAGTRTVGAADCLITCAFRA